MAELTLTIRNEHVPRVLAAYGEILGLTDENGGRRSATANELRQYIIAKMRRQVKNAERQIIEATEVDVS